jgi:hypothetical protein
MQFRLRLIFAVAVLLVVGRVANACSCGGRPTVLEAFEDADEVVILRAMSVEKVADTARRSYVDGVRSTTMIVEKVFKGHLKVNEEIVFGQGGGADCIWTFNEKSVGQQFLVYLAKPEKLADLTWLASKTAGLWLVMGCGRSSRLETAADDLLYLENIDKVRGKTRISGSLGGWQNPNLEVAGKRIKIIGAKKTYDTKTNKDGVFEIYGLPPGKYFIEPELPAGWKIDPNWLEFSPSVVLNEDEEPEMKSSKQVAIILQPKKHAGIDIVFELDNHVRGRVIGPKGTPMPGVCVHLLPPLQENSDSFDCTDNQGRFDIKAIPDGEYVVVANQDGKPSAFEPFRRVFYPSVTEREQAASISIRPGETIEGIDIVIPKLEETVLIKGVLRYSDGKPAVEEWVKFKVAATDDRVDGDVNVKTDRMGRFTLTALKGVSGELAGQEWVYKGFYENCPKVEELIAASGRSGINIQSNVIKLTTDQNTFGVELTLPFPRCEKAKD